MLLEYLKLAQLANSALYYVIQIIKISVTPLIKQFISIS